MADANAAGQNSADEAARRAAEEARRREIMEKIRQLEQEKAGCEDLKSALNGKKDRLEGIISQVNGLKTKKLEADIQRFSGMAADGAETGISDAQIVMGKKNSSFSGVETAIGPQITLLDSYIAELGGQINALRASL
ncbi:MAG: hypothetical protein K2J95_06515 [Lachnospiraceae bacterium]|nr:hypothetical protein [Lachnospiraceae bacterium]